MIAQPATAGSYEQIGPRFSDSDSAPILVLRLSKPKTTFERFLDILKKDTGDSDDLSQRLREAAIEIIDVIQYETEPKETKQLKVQALIHKIRDQILRNPINLAFFKQVVIEGSIAYEKKDYELLWEHFGGISPVDGHVMEKSPKAHFIANEMLSLIDDLYKECKGESYEAYKKELDSIGELNETYMASYVSLLKNFELSKMLKKEEQTAELLVKEKSLQRKIKQLQWQEEEKIHLAERIKELQANLATNEQIIAVTKQFALDRIKAAITSHEALLKTKQAQLEAEKTLSSIQIEAKLAEIENLKRIHECTMASLEQKEEQARREHDQAIAIMHQELSDHLKMQAELILSQENDAVTIQQLSIETQKKQAAVRELQLKVQENARRTQEIADDNDSSCSVM